MRKRPHVVVVGSSNTDMVARAPRLPGPGETVLGDSFAMVPGGKGANQAVAAARLGAHVTFIARIGTDVFGDAAVAALAADGIDVGHIVRDADAPSGVALIGVSSSTGENSIIVAPGANARLSPDDVRRLGEVIASADMVVCQLEIPMETVEAAVQIARDAGVRVVLNPAPAQPLAGSLLSMVTVLTPNETEVDVCWTAGFGPLAPNPGGIGPENSAHELVRRGVPAVVVTLGADGVFVSTSDGDSRIAASHVETVVDTTAAGDCFTGALAVGLAEGKSLIEAVEFANVAAGICVTRAGAQPSLPKRDEVERVLGLTRSG